jgi:hypothetical protein
MNYSKSIFVPKLGRVFLTIIISLLTTLLLGITANAADLSYGAAGGFDVSEAVFDQSFDIGDNSSNLQGFIFNDDGTKFYVGENGAAEVDEYALEVPYDVSTATYTDSLSVDSGHSVGLEFNDDGTVFYVVNYVGNDVNEYALAVPYDISTGVYTDNIVLTTQDANPYDIIFNEDGTVMIMVGNNTSNLYIYSLGVAYDVSTATYTDTSFDVNANGGAQFPRSITWNTDGTKMYVVSNSTDDIHEYNLGTPYDVTTATFIDTLDVSGPTGGQPYSFGFSPDGSRLVVSRGSDQDSLVQYAIPSGYPEAPANDGSVLNTTPLVITLNEDTFTGANGSDLVADLKVTIGNIPDGLTAVLTKDSDTQATLTFTGNATTHENPNDVSDLTFVFDDSAFTSGDASSVVNSGDGEAYSSNVGIDFNTNAGVTITESDDSTDVAEPATQDTYDLALAVQPTEDVVITIATSSEDISVSPSVLTFTDENWDEAQTVTLSSVDDNETEDAEVATITHTASSAGEDYDELSISNVTVNIAESDADDADEDGISDETELIMCTNIPALAGCADISRDDDTDGDGIPDLTEYYDSTDPTDENDPTLNGDADTDLDGILDGTESYACGTTTCLETTTDTDEDGVPDWIEILNSTDFNDVNEFPDTDGDGNSDYSESLSFNGGDGNGDGTPDSEQQSVSSTLNPVTENYTTLEANGDCTFITENAIVAESSLAAEDPSADYPVGLVDFRVECDNPGDSATVTIYYSEQYNTSNWSYKKYTSDGDIYADITELVTFGEYTYAAGPNTGTTVTTATFTVTDGDSNTDEDGVANSIIDDPSGPALVLATSSSSSSSSGGRVCKFSQLERLPSNRGNGLDTGLFTDLTGNERAYKYAVDLAEQDIIHGADTTQFANLNALVNRAETAKMLSIAASHTITTSTYCLSDSFSDVADDEWYFTYIHNMQQKNIIHGYLDGSFKPSQSINLAELYKLTAITFGFITNEEANQITTNPELWYQPYQQELESRSLLPEWFEQYQAEHLVTREDIFALLSQVLAYLDKVEI